MTTAAVDLLRPTDTDDAASVIAVAFANLEIARWLVPHDGAERERCLREQFAFLIRAAFSSDGRVQGIHEHGRLIAVAVWTIRPGSPTTAPPGYDATLRSITGDHYPRFRALDDAFDATTPEVPHHQLALLAASRRGTGLGTRLLTSYLSWADQRHEIPPMLHLHASNIRSALLYARHGFNAEAPAEVPGSDGAFVFPMSRHPPAALGTPPSSGVHLVRP
jgi:GNAT superfamily N-acetyltransferase